MFVTTRYTFHNVQFIFLAILVALLKSCTLTEAESCVSESINCVCSYEYLKLDLRETILSSSPQYLITRLQSYQCQQFRLLPNVLVSGQQHMGGGHVMQEYKSNSNADYRQGDYHEDPNAYSGNQISPNYAPNRPRLRKRHQAAGSGDNHKARLENVVHQFPHETVPHSYAFLGHRIQLPCNSNSNNRYQGTTFNWAHSNGNPVYAPAVTLNGETGVLTIPAVQLSDIDIYQCEELLPNGQNITTSHRLSVVTDSIHWLSITSYYGSHGCNAEEMQDIQNNLKTWIGNYICPICTVHDSSVICDAGSTGSPQYVIQFALTAFNFENEIDTRLDLGFCPEICLQAIHLLLLRIVGDSVRKLFARPIQGSNGNIFYPHSETLHIELMTGCLAGFEFHSKICFPCKPGHYSERGESDCVECTHGSYQAALAASRCIPCQEDHDSIDDGATSSSACLPLSLVNAYHSVDDNRASALAAAIILVILFLIIISCVVFCCCCPNTKIGRLLRNVCCYPCRFCSKKKEKSRGSAKISTVYAKESPQEPEKDDLIKIKETTESEFRSIPNRSPKRSWKKIVKTKVPHMWTSSKHKSEYTQLPQVATSSSGESEPEGNKNEAMEGESALQPQPSEYEILPQKNSRKNSHENERNLSLKKDILKQKRYSTASRNSRFDSQIQNTPKQSTVSRNSAIQAEIQTPEEHYRVSGNSIIDNEIENSGYPSMAVRGNSVNDYEYQNTRYPSVVSRNTATDFDIKKTRNDSTVTRFPTIEYEIHKTRKHPFDENGRKPSGKYKIGNSHENSTVRRKPTVDYELDKTRNPSMVSRNSTIYEDQSTRKHSTVSRKPTIDYEVQNTRNPSMVSRNSVNNYYECQNNGGHSKGSRKPSIDYEIQDSRKESTVSRKPTIDYEIQDYREESTVSRKPTIDYEIQDYRKESTVSRKPTIDYEIQDSRKESTVSRKPTIDYEIQDYRKESTVSRKPTIDYEIQDSRKESTVSRKPTIDYEIQDSQKQSRLSRTPTIDYDIQNCHKQSQVSTHPAIDVGIQNSRKSSNRSDKKSSFFNSEIQSRQHSIEQSRNILNNEEKCVMAVHKNSHFDDSAAASRLPSSNVGVQTLQDESIRDRRYSAEQSRSYEGQDRVDSCERCYERIQNRLLQDLAAPKKHSVADDEALSKVRVRDTIEKINAVSNFSKQRPTVYDMHSQHRNRRGCSKEQSSKGDAELTSGDWHQQPFDSRWDHNCHRCIKPSLRQPRFLPPAPPK